MSGQAAAASGRVMDPSASVEWFFQRAIEEPFGRHIRGIENEFSMCGYGLLRIYVNPDPRMTAGRARIAIERVPGGIGPRSLRVVWIVYGVRGMRLGINGLDPTIDDSERRNIIAVRLAIAHELGHLAMRHAVVGNELSVPSGGFNDAQDWEASAYAVYLLRHTGRYLHDRGKLLSPTHQAVSAWVERNWPHFAESPRTASFMKQVTKRARPWSELSDEEIDKRRDDPYPTAEAAPGRRKSR